jgi:hypothetical protein
MWTRLSRSPATLVACLFFAIVWSFGVAGEYGWFVDELYFVACARRPDLGYVDHPPLATLVLAAIRTITGETLWAIRIIPALAGAAGVWLAGGLARKLGGDRFAELFAAVLVATAPAVLVIAGFYSMNPFELVLAIALASTAVGLADGEPPNRWLVFGALAGIAFLTKHTSIVPAGLFTAGLLASPARRHLTTRWPWLGLGLALLIAAPNLVWLAQHDWITLEFYRESTRLKNIATTPLDALVGQVLFVGPIAFVLAIGGAIALCRNRARRGLGACFFVGLAIMLVAGVSRPDRILGLYPLVFAAAAAAIDRRVGRRRWVRRGVVAVVILGVLPPLPLVVPVLPPDTLERYATWLDVTPELERDKGGNIGQWMADRFGWYELAGETARVVQTLPDAERSRVVLVGEDYGAAGALELYGPSLGLPDRVISTHNAYWLWGPGKLFDDSILVVVGGDPRLRHLFVDVHEVGRVRCRHCYKHGTPIWIARGQLAELASAWPHLRLFR